MLCYYRVFCICLWGLVLLFAIVIRISILNARCLLYLVLKDHRCELDKEKVMTKKGLGSLLVGSCASVFCVAVFGLFFYSAMNGYVSVTHYPYLINW